MWHGAFPWVYSHDESSWWYLKAGTDGKFYAWKYADKQWYSFDEASKAWVPVNGETEADKWAKWEANPEPYGGLEVLAKIRQAKESNSTSLDLLGDDLNKKIIDLSPLAGLTKLEGLYLDSNRITDISPLSRLTKLTSLWLDGNQITDVPSLAGLTDLKQLDLSYNKISDVSPLAGLTNLEYLNLYNNEITDVSSLNGLTNLKELLLHNNQISDDQKAMLKKALPNCDISF